MIIGFWAWISAIVAIAITAVITAIAAAVIWALINGTINLKYLLAEPADPSAQANAQANVQAMGLAPGATGAGVGAQPPEVPKASLSRLQFLIFTFVIAGVYLVLCLESGRFVDIPQNVILLLGVSGGSYVIAKGIKTAGDNQ